LLVIAPAGTGKSRVSRDVGSVNPAGKLFIDRVTVANLKRYKTDLEYFSGSVIVDDIAGMITEYSRVATAVLFAKLTYEHVVDMGISNERIKIKGFDGSTTTNIQPTIFQQLCGKPEWEAHLRDKTIRWYHLLRPLKPNKKNINLEVEWGADRTTIKWHNNKTKLNALYRIGVTQWSPARVVEHIPDLVKATASLDGRSEVNENDYKLLLWLMKPLNIERYVLTKEAFESHPYFDRSVLYALTELATYGNKLTLDHIQRNYGVSERNAYRLIQSVKPYIIPRQQTGDFLRPTKRALEILREGGYF